MFALDALLQELGMALYIILSVLSGDPFVY